MAILFIIGGCFPIVFRKRKMRCQRKGKSCSCTDSQTSSQESIDSIDSLSVVEPATWQMPPKGRKRTRTISGASNFSGTSTMSTLSEKDRMWLQAFRYAGRWDAWLDEFPMKAPHCLHRICGKRKMKETFVTIVKRFSGLLWLRWRARIRLDHDITGTFKPYVTGEVIVYVYSLNCSLWNDRKCVNVVNRFLL